MPYVNVYNLKKILPWGNMPLIAYIELTIPCLSTCSEGKEESYVLFIN